MMALIRMFKSSYLVFPRLRGFSNAFAALNDCTSLQATKSNAILSGIFTCQLTGCPQNKGYYCRGFHTNSVLLLSTAIHEQPRNRKIKARTVLLIDNNGKNLGEMTLENALDKAQDMSLHLVQIERQTATKPALCKLLSPKMMFESEKKAKHGSHCPKVKELKITGRIAPQDLVWKSKKIHDLLESGHPVKLSITRKSYQKISLAEKKEILQKVIEDVQDVGTVVGEPKEINPLILRCIFSPTGHKNQHQST